jgi:hypothetical protein
MTKAKVATVYSVINAGRTSAPSEWTIPATNT